jgi:lysophospholipid acyltransferase (LPLAT)-like uncharacterized protein
MHKLLTELFAHVFVVFLRLVCGLNRMTVTRQDVFDTYAEQGNNIFVFWHSRLFYLVYYYIHSRVKCRISALVSMSKDGDYGAALARRLRQDAVRGSTSRGAQKAIRELATKAAGGYNLAITPDGPRGPVSMVGEGVIRLAQLTGARIIPVSYDATRKRLLKSWDRFIVVKPFGRVHVAFAEPFQVPRNITAEERGRYVERLQQTLSSLDRLCDERLRRGVTPEAEWVCEMPESKPPAVSPRERAETY